MTETAPHGALMDAVYRHQRHVYDATRRFYLLGRDRLITELAVPPHASVLEVACGTGRNLGRIGQRYPRAQLYGFDISTQMLATARRNLGTRARLATGDACAFDAEAAFGVPAFDRVVVSYALSMIPDWQGALAEAWRLTAPGGTLAVVDFGGFAGWPGWFQRAQTAWLRKFHVCPRADLSAAIAALATGGAEADLSRLHGDYAVLGRVTRPG